MRFDEALRRPRRRTGPQGSGDDGDDAGRGATRAGLVEHGVLRAVRDSSRLRRHASPHRGRHVRARLPAQRDGPRARVAPQPRARAHLPRDGEGAGRHGRRVRLLRRGDGARERVPPRAVALPHDPGAGGPRPRAPGDGGRRPAHGGRAGRRPRRRARRGRGAVHDDRPHARRHGPSVRGHRLRAHDGRRGPAPRRPRAPARRPRQPLAGDGGRRLRADVPRRGGL